MTSPKLFDSLPANMNVDPPTQATDTPTPVAEDTGMIEYTPVPLAESSRPAAPEPIEPVFATTADTVLLPTFNLGQDDTRIPLNDLALLQQATEQLLAQARREILIITPDLEFARFDHEGFCRALSAFARSSRHTVTRILVGDPRLAVKEGHQLVSLTRRLSTMIEIRQIDEDHLKAVESVIVADDIGLLRCTDRDPWQGSLLPKAIPYAQRWREIFYEWWQRSDEILDFRELRI